MLFFGTPDFAVPTLAALVESGRPPALVVSQPARRRGRGRQLQQPPVARWALAAGFEVAQPESVRSAEFLDRIAGLEPAVAVVVAFGQIFPPSLLDLPLHGCINVHASLLPRYRGAAPIQAAIIAGDRVTGITTMRMEAGLDTGPILLQRRVDIGAEETAGELSERLANVGAELLVETLEGLERGDIEARAQDDSMSSLAPRLRKEDGVIDWSADSDSLFNRLRGLTPWPGISTRLRDETVKVLWGRPILAPPESTQEPGTILGVEGSLLAVACGGGSRFGIERLQRPGRRPVTAEAFANGLRLEVGERFG